MSGMIQRLLVPFLTLVLLFALRSPVLATEGKGENTDSSVLTTYTTISSLGPLSRIFLGTDAAAQITHATITGNQVYPTTVIPADFGTILFTGNTLYTPDFSNHGGTATSNLGTRTPFTPISQSGVTGSGTAANPYQVQTTVAAGSTGLRLIHTDRYIIGQESYQTDIQIVNSTAVTQTAILYRAMDCFLGGSDSGYGAVDAATGSVACSRNANNSPAGLIEQFVPITAGSRYYHAGYAALWSFIGTRQPFPNTCACTTSMDNGMGLSWNITVPPNGQTTVSHITTFSPTGVLPLITQKTAASPSSAPGDTNSYTITVRNPNAGTIGTLLTISDVLPAGFSYMAGSTSGATTANPTISGQTLTWTGPFIIPASGSISLTFRVIVSTTPGTYFNNATATSTLAVAPTGNTAPITVVAPTTVELESFDAVWEEDGVHVTWVTLQEINTLGFHLWRSAEGMPRERLTSELIAAQSPGGSQGATYTWIDTTATPGQVYDYWLEEIEVSGQSNWYGPVSTTLLPSALTLSTVQVNTDKNGWQWIAAAASIVSLGSLGWWRKAKNHHPN